MTKHDKNIIFLLCVTLFLLVFFTYPTLKPYMTTPASYQIDKEPDEPKQYEDLLKRGAVPKLLQVQRSPPFYETLGKKCEPFGSIFSVISPFITFELAIWNWIRKPTHET